MDTSDILNALTEQRNAAANQAAMAQAQLAAANRRIKELEDRINTLKRLVPPDATEPEA
jgi:transcription elongation GreA/GreB family factor